MFKEGVRDILEKLDNDLVGLIPVKRRVREIAALLVLDKVKIDRSVFEFLPIARGNFSASFVPRFLNLERSIREISTIRTKSHP